jgi:hypothetical protein
MTREPHVMTPQFDPGRPNLGSPDWWRRNTVEKPDWWERVFSVPFDAADARKAEKQANGD